MNLTTISRPYVKAILFLAQDKATRAKWSEMLLFISLVCKNKQASDYVFNLSVSPQEKANFICNIAADNLDEQGRNLVRLLAAKQRLHISSALYVLYEKMRKAVEKELSLDLVSAQDVSSQDKEYLSSLFDEEWVGGVKLSCQIDPNLIAGVKLKIGDRVIESSIKERLKKFYNHLAR